MKHGKTQNSESSDDGAEFRKRAALLGHDIGNAVSDILGGLALADLAPLDAPSRQQLQRVRSAGEQLARLSDEVLALIAGDAPTGRAGGGSRLPAFLDDIEARWAPHARGRGLRFTVERAADLPAVIGIDRTALERILANLIGNAMKHTVSGEVTLSVGMQRRETLTLTVRDTGPGISDAAMAQLFEAGGRAPQSDTPGSGLGLHIVRDLARKIGARMDVANRAGGGAEVALRLPRAAWAPGVTVRGPAALPDLTGFDVLVAEDNQTNQLLLRQMLETLGAAPRLAEDGQAAQALLESADFDLALIDIEMPRLSGLDVIRGVRRHETRMRRAAPLPILAITAYVLNANRVEIYDAGADGILAKPIMSIESFGEAIGAVLKGRDHAESGPETGNAPAFSTLHLDRLLALAGDENGAELLSRLTQDFRTVRTGVQAGLSEPDFALLRARTHVLISLAGAIGADQLQSMAETLNRAAHDRDSGRAAETGRQVVRQIGSVLELIESEYAERLKAGAA